MTSVIGLLSGLVGGTLLVGLAYGGGEQGARRMYAVGLLAAALMYVGFAAAGGASAGWLSLEIVGLAFYGGVAWAGVRRWPVLLALGWTTHAGWDVVLHLDGAGAAYTPTWYPWLCVSFDLVLAGAVVDQTRRRSVPDRAGAAG
jgi:hypothetical protein